MTRLVVLSGLGSMGMKGVSESSLRRRKAFAFSQQLPASEGGFCSIVAPVREWGRCRRGHRQSDDLTLTLKAATSHTIISPHRLCVVASTRRLDCSATHLNDDLRRSVCLSVVVTDLKGDLGACLDVDAAQYGEEHGEKIMISAPDEQVSTVLAGAHCQV